jgi:hypothetical protein
MSRATTQYHDPNPAEQLSLLSRVELAELRSSIASRPRKGELKGRKERRHDIEERFIQSGGATQPKLPGI